jgi:hypothetical protein
VEVIFIRIRTGSGSDRVYGEVNAGETISNAVLQVDPVATAPGSDTGIGIELGMAARRTLM